MKLDSYKIEKIYSGNTVKHYDLPISHMFSKYKKQAFSDSDLKLGDNVIVFCCGTGLDFPEILKRIGKEGSILGVDFSEHMLAKAGKRIAKNRWRNIELIRADITQYKNTSDRKFDAGVCILGMSLIPDYRLAYNNLLSCVIKGGMIIIGDMQLAEGHLSRLNPLTIFLAKRFGGTYEGHKNSINLCSLMQDDLNNFKKKEFFLKSYFYCIGNKP